MGIIDKASDSLIKKIAKKETIRVTYEELANMTDKLFLSDADGAFAKKSCKNRKGRLPRHPKISQIKIGKIYPVCRQQQMAFRKVKANLHI